MAIWDSTISTFNPRLWLKMDSPLINHGSFYFGSPGNLETNPFFLNVTGPDLITQSASGGITGAFLQYPNTSNNILRFNAASSWLPEISNKAFSVGIWFKTNTVDSSGYAVFNLRTSTAFNQGRVVMVIGGTTNPDPAIAGKLFGLATTYNDGSGTGGDSTRIVIPGSTYASTDNNWHFGSMTINGSTIKFYYDGIYVGQTTMPDGGLKPNQFNIGDGAFSGQMDDFVLFDYVLSDSQMLEIYEAAVPPSINISITETPATATALVVDSSNSTSSIILVDPIITSALMTEPTIVIVNNDHVEITTSITASATFPNALFGSEFNISYSSTSLTASSEILDHTTILGTGLLYTPEAITASALIVTPPFVGSADKTIFVDNITASALVVDPTLFITPNYYNIVRSDNPSLFVTDPPEGMTSSTFVNKGYDNWGVSGNIGDNVLVATSPGSFATVGNGKSITQSSDGTQTGITFSFTDAEANSQADYFQLTGGGANDFTHEFWIYPRTYDGSSLENVISIGSTLVKVSATQIEIAMNSDDIPNDGILVPYTHTVNASLTTGTWHHVVITGNYTSASDLATVIYHNGEVKGSKSFFHFKSAPTDAGIVFNANSGDLYAYYNGIALYKYVLSYSDILAHYDFVASSSPNRNIDSLPIEASALLVNPNFIVVANKNFPATPITASTLAVEPSVLAAVGDGYDAEVLAGSATFVNPYFYGDPDVTIAATALTASVDTPQNVYRVDTAYYSYVQTNIAPIRFVTFDVPNSNVDWGSDDDFAEVAPFVYDGTITAANDGLNNNSLLSTGTNYITSGLIMKESQWDDDWGTAAGSYHSSYWIKRHPSDTGANGLRIIQSAYSPINGAYGILYQQNNLLKMEMFNGTSYFTATSASNVNVFDYGKHHIVVNFRKTGSNHFVDIYVNKVLKISINVGEQSLVFQNSATYLAPNTETNNMARMSVGALIPLIANTSLPVTPTATKMYIDDVHWAATSITQTDVNNLYAAMPYRVDINWLSDTFLSNQSSLVDPLVLTQTRVNATVLTASGLTVNPTLIVDYDRIINATAITASAQIVNPFSVIGDSITNKIIVSDIFIASASLATAVQGTTLQAQPMTATARIPASLPSWFDPYRALILQQSLTYPAGDYYGYKVGDID
jgi:hypothetical protein